MNLLVLISNSFDTSQISQVASMLPKYAKIEIFDNDFKHTNKLLIETHIDFLTIITSSNNFPNIEMTKVDCPTIIMKGVDDHHLFSIMNLLPLSMQTDEPTKKESSEKLFNRSLEFIENNLNDSNMCLNMVSSHVHISRCHYSRLFKQYLGTGFKNYIIKRRIHKAKILLEQGNSVTDVCYEVGYTDLTHFSRIFKKVEGLNPSNFKINIRNNS